MTSPTTNALPVPGAVLAPAGAADAAEILVLQRCCWVTEAIENDRLDVPALHESAEQVRERVRTRPHWTVRLDGRLVGGVGARLLADGKTWDIGRLMVAPDLAGRGLGRALLAFAEGQAPPGVTTFTLFTGERSVRNRRMYARAGYGDVRPARLPDGTPVPGAVMMDKPAL
ncbi:acetyltransferase (GNAT) family protein [Pseudonocardia sediminis]|uniref:Acetyltransferase (GNAT) family protein n=1 Tax=Pseudonocardia sediminis TaxID=1397368 RepID=A0A4Q7UVP5_PSEST|nr:GNAT family N-acetyltransferase [Pseudonocardia sediminis]RZT84173.1 acetyltransferase (GNAT) family protein [Pseudonocardia sediminis]